MIEQTDGGDTYQHMNSNDVERLAKVPPWLRDFCWEPGESGNPHGRPSDEERFAKLLSAFDLDLVAKDHGLQRQLADALCQAISDPALPGRLKVRIAAFLLHLMERASMAHMEQ